MRLGKESLFKHSLALNALSLSEKVLLNVLLAFIDYGLEINAASPGVLILVKILIL